MMMYRTHFPSLAFTGERRLLEDGDRFDKVFTLEKKLSNLDLIVMNYNSKNTHNVTTWTNIFIYWKKFGKLFFQKMNISATDFWQFDNF